MAGIHTDRDSGRGNQIWNSEWCHTTISITIPYPYPTHHCSVPPHFQKKPIPIRNLVMKKSTTTMSTEATTMAWVVARPTPSVPPVVCSPW